MRAREALLESELFPGDISTPVPDLHPGCVRHRQLRRGARAAPPRWPAASPRRADDDPRGVGEPHAHGSGAPGLLPVPRVADGAVGRPRQRELHRRHRDRCRAGPQRAAPGPVLGHRRRPRGPRLRGRRARHPRRSGGPQGPPPARQDVPGRHRPGPDHRRRRGQGRPWPPSCPTRPGSTRGSSSSTSCPSGPTCATPTATSSAAS